MSKKIDQILKENKRMWDEIDSKWDYMRLLEQRMAEKQDPITDENAFLTRLKKKYANTTL